jgi:hypothetical protein
MDWPEPQLPPSPGKATGKYRTIRRSTRRGPNWLGACCPHWSPIDQCPEGGTVPLRLWQWALSTTRPASANAMRSVRAWTVLLTSTSSPRLHRGNDVPISGSKAASRGLRPPVIVGFLPRRGTPRTAWRRRHFTRPTAETRLKPEWVSVGNAGFHVLWPERGYRRGLIEPNIGVELLW